MKKVVINRVDLGQRVTGYEVFNPGVNGGEVLGYTPKQMGEAVKAGGVVGLALRDGELVMDEAHGFKSMMVKTGAGTLTSTSPDSVANIMYVAYDRAEGDKFKVISSRFGRLVFCADKIKALMDLGAVSGILQDGEDLVPFWELDKRAEGKKEDREPEVKAEDPKGESKAPEAEPEAPKAEGETPAPVKKAGGKKK